MDSLSREMGFSSTNTPDIIGHEHKLQSEFYEPVRHQVHISEDNVSPAVLAHELGHASFRSAKAMDRLNFHLAGLASGTGQDIVAGATMSILNNRLANRSLSKKQIGAALAGLGVIGLGNYSRYKEEQRASERAMSAISKLKRSIGFTSEDASRSNELLSKALNTYKHGLPINALAQTAGGVIIGGGAHLLGRLVGNDVEHLDQAAYAVPAINTGLRGLLYSLTVGRDKPLNRLLGKPEGAYRPLEDD
jgi:Zn-dependent membrane protease YugP